MPRLERLEVLDDRLPVHNSARDEVHDDMIHTHDHSLTDSITKLPCLKKLIYRGLIPGEEFLLRLRYLECLSLHNCVALPSTFDWIRQYRSLRVLELEIEAGDMDLSPIGRVSTILDFTLIADSREVRLDLSFLRKLPNLVRLSVRGCIYDLEVLRGLTKLRHLVITTFVPEDHVDALGSLVGLRTIDITSTTITNIESLVKLPLLKIAAIPTDADCRPIVKFKMPRLLKLLHPFQDCKVWCQRREQLDEWERCH